MWSCGWAAAVFLCERRSDPPGLELGRLDIGTSLLKGHTLSRHYHSLQSKRERSHIRILTRGNGVPCMYALLQQLALVSNRLLFCRWQLLHHQSPIQPIWDDQGNKCHFDQYCASQDTNSRQRTTDPVTDTTIWVGAETWWQKNHVQGPRQLTVDTIKITVG